MLRLIDAWLFGLLLRLVSEWVASQLTRHLLVACLMVAAVHLAAWLLAAALLLVAALV